MVREPSLTSIDVDGWEIDDAEVAHAESKETYKIPSLNDRLSLNAGDLAKIRFYIRTEDDDGEITDHGERMWVKILSKSGNWYFGELDNQPSCTSGISPGLEVSFQPRHVISIHRA